MSREIFYGDEARRKIQTGVDKLANAVKVTLGPKGRNVVIDRGYGSPIITKDGVTVAREIGLKDKYENLGATLIKEAASRTNDSAGDGTTTATVLAQAIISGGLKSLAEGKNPLALRRGIEKASAAVIEYLKKNVVRQITEVDLEKVASISANDKEIGKIVAEAMQKVGKDGAITVEESQAFGITTDVVKGMRFNAGYLSPYMVTNAERAEAEYEDVPVLVVSKKISLPTELIPVLEKLMHSGQKKVLLVAEDIGEEALTFLVMNKIKDKFFPLAVRAPSARRGETLFDIAVLTGATVIGTEAGITLEDAEVEHFGRAKRVISSQDTTTIIEGAGDQKAIEARVNQIKAAIETTELEFDRERLRARVGKLTGGVGVIRVGARSEVDMLEKKHRIEDAVHATKAAMEEGIVPGCGMALYKAEIDGLVLVEDELYGKELLHEAIAYPTGYILENAGMISEEVLGRIRNNVDPAMGWNAETGEYVNLFDAGIVDPFKVVRMALENAVSVAATFLTTECVVMELSEEK